MIVDNSALLAVLLHKPDATRYETSIATAPSRRMSTVNVLESSIVVESRGGEAAVHELDAFLKRAGIKWTPVTTEQVKVARVAWRQFGKGNHPARLNLGDCFAYALARTAEEPLLFKGDDFSRTDIEAT